MSHKEFKIWEEYRNYPICGSVITNMYFLDDDTLVLYLDEPTPLDDDTLHSFSVEYQIDNDKFVYTEDFYDGEEFIDFITLDKSPYDEEKQKAIEGFLREVSEKWSEKWKNRNKC
jgi:hypothetical protein